MVGCGQLYHLLITPTPLLSAMRLKSSEEPQKQALSLLFGTTLPAGPHCRTVNIPMREIILFLREALGPGTQCEGFYLLSVTQSQSPGCLPLMSVLWICVTLRRDKLRRTYPWNMTPFNERGFPQGRSYRSVIKDRSMTQVPE